MRSLTRPTLGAAITLLAALSTPAAPAAAAVPPAASSAQWTLDAQHFDGARIRALSTGRGVTVAVVDSGVDVHHPDLTGRVLPGADFTGGATDGRIDLSSNGHGTSVAGIIAGNGAGPDGVTGLAPDAAILPVRVSADLASDPAALAQGIDYATTHGAKIINVSVCAQILNPQVRDAIDAAIRNDIVVIAAAGNDGLSGNRPLYPAALPGVVAVAASDVHGALWPNSESGSYIGITAPGVDIYVPGAQGTHQRTTGTSFAAPQVAATAALLRSRYPTENATQIINRLTTTAHPIGQRRSTQWGFGIVDPYQALTTQAVSSTAVNSLLAPTALAKPAVSSDGGQPTSVYVATVTVLLTGAAAGAALLLRRRRRR